MADILSSTGTRDVADPGIFLLNAMMFHAPTSPVGLTLHLKLGRNTPNDGSTVEG